METLTREILILTGEWVTVTVERTADAPARYRVGAGTRYAVGPTPELAASRYANRAHWTCVGVLTPGEDRTGLESKRLRMVAQQESAVSDLFKPGAPWPRADEIRVPRTLDEADAALRLAETALAVQPPPGTSSTETEARRARFRERWKMKHAEILYQREKLRVDRLPTQDDLDDVWGGACVAAAALEAAGVVLPPEAAGFFALARQKFTGERRARWEGRNRARTARRFARLATLNVEIDEDDATST
jgi:hypothetical protein